MKALVGLARRGGEDQNARGLLVGTAGTVALNVTAVVLNLVVVLLLTRQLGAAGFGAYASAFAWASILSVLAVLGLTPLVVRQVASYHSLESWGLLRGLLRRSNQSIAVSAAATMSLAAVLGYLIYGGQPELLHPFWIALLLVPLIALTSLRQAAMQGLGRVVVGRIAETVISPLLFIVFAGACAAAVDPFSASWAAAAQVTAAACAFGVGATLLRSTLPSLVRKSAPRYDMPSWRRSGLSLVLLNVVMAANAQMGTILLGAMGNAKDAGIFNVAARTTTFISFMMLAATYPLMPLVARLHTLGARDEMQRIVTRAVRIVLLFAAPTALALIVLGSTVLGIFGGGFEDGASAMRILAIGEVVNVVTGFGGVVLVMTGHERDLAWSVAFGALVNLVLTLLLIPLAGVDGAAVGAAAGLACSNVIMARLAWRRVGVWSPVVGRSALRAQVAG